MIDQKKLDLFLLYVGVFYVVLGQASQWELNKKLSGEIDLSRYRVLPIPENAKVDKNKHWGQINRGMLQPLSEEERFKKEKLDLGAKAYGEAYRSFFQDPSTVNSEENLNYGLGFLPEEDQFDLNRWKEIGLNNIKFKSELRKKIISELTSQCEGVNPLKKPLSWSQVKFHKMKKWNFNNHVFGRDEDYRHSAIELEFTIETKAFGEMRLPGKMFIPESVLLSGGKAPVVLYQHFHGEGYSVGVDELIKSWNFWGEGKIYQVLNKLGFISVGIDFQGFRRRRMNDQFRDSLEGAKDLSSKAEEFHGGQYGANVKWIGDHQDKLEDARKLAKIGSSRYAMRICEDLTLFRLIKSLNFVDSDNMFSMGMSMGGVRSWTLAALLGSELKGIAANGTLPRFYRTISESDHKHADLHHLAGQFFMKIPSLGINYIDTEHYLYLATDTNLMLQMGSQDFSSPGWREIYKLLETLHKNEEGPKKSLRLIEENSDHEFTQSNLRDAFTFFWELANPGKKLKDHPILKLNGH